MFVTEIELTTPSEQLTNLDRYRAVRALVRLRGRPIGLVTAPILDGRCSDQTLRRAAAEALAWPIVRQTFIDEHTARDLELPSRPPTVTVAVCTRNRAHSLETCLAALARLDPAPREMIVVDNAPADDATREMVARYPEVRYVRETAPGLDRARSRAVLEATSDVVAFTDDDVIVDPGWVGAVAAAFQTGDHVAAVTGLVLPHELETPAQELFERYGGFGRGFDRRWYRVDAGLGERASALHGGTGKFGTGANMSFRRDVLLALGLFDPALDVGTVTNGGGDLEMFHRVLAAGHVLMYEPSAIVWHRHRREYAQLREQLTNNGIGFYSYLTRGVLSSAGDRAAFARLALWWLWRWNVRRLLQSYYKPGAFPRDLILAELAGSFAGMRRYQQASRAAAADPPPAQAAGNRGRDRRHAFARGRRAVSIDGTVGQLAAVQQFCAVDLTVVQGSRALGTVTIHNRHDRIPAARAVQAIADEFGAALVAADAETRNAVVRARAAAIARVDLGEPHEPPLDAAVSASIVIATRDRPADLRRALASIARIETARRLEVVVVDNHPASGLTPPVVAEFPGVTLVDEPRPGLSYARNAGIAASSGEIVIATDDDVEVPAGWLERLIAPFADREVMVVTGDVVAAGLESRAQRLFEAYGGLGRGSERFAVGVEWFWEFRGAVPTWTLGGTANAAFRASIFRHPEIGLLEPSLGAGTPAGCSEDTDLFYRVLRAGYRIVYEPRACVRHHHRADMRGLRRQIYAYAKGHVAYQLTTLARNRDYRALWRLFVELPIVYAKRVRERLFRGGAYPLALVVIEVAGTLAGPFAWWRSRRRARRLGASVPYRPAKPVVV